MKLLRASFDEPITSTFPHPCDIGSVRVIIDAVHMLKLVRNTFVFRGNPRDFLGRDIKFEYFVTQMHKNIFKTRTLTNFSDTKVP